MLIFPNDAGQDEDCGGTARRLSEAHLSSQGVPHRQRGALQHVADGCKLFHNCPTLWYCSILAATAIVYN